MWYFDNITMLVKLEPMYLLAVCMMDTPVWSVLAHISVTCSMAQCTEILESWQNIYLGSRSFLNETGAGKIIQVVLCS